ncbi:hypothetical protein RB597_007502 [Gaeumannomyces tritici]
MRSHTSFAGLVAALSLACSAVAKLSKPHLTNPELRNADVWWRQAHDMEADLPEHSYRSEDWDNNYIPEVFLSLYYQSASFNYSIWDVETKNVYFSDCPHPNVVSRHRGSQKSWDDVFRAFSKSPVGIRAHMSNLLIIPDEALVNVAGYAPATAAVFVSQYFHLPVMIHEGFHGLDVIAFRDEVAGRYSEWSTWWSVYDKDSHVVTDYARTNQIENFAETGHWAVADMTRGLANYTTHRAQVANQLDHVRARLGAVLFPGGWPSGGACTRKVAAGPIVDKRTLARLDLAGGSRIMGGGDRGLEWAFGNRAGAGGVPIIELPEDLDWTPPKPVLLSGGGAYNLAV